AVVDADGKEVSIVGPNGRPVRPNPTDRNGRSTIRFVVPTGLSRGDVRLKVTFQFLAADRPDPNDPRKVLKGGQTAESIAERVPVAIRPLIAEFFPEGGELVAGVPCRVYVRVTTPTGQPADISGAITDGKRVVARVATANDPAEPGVNRGLGAFTFTPEPDTSYRLVP